jgi:hypothetical protein
MLVLLASASVVRMELSAYFVIPYYRVGLIQFFFGVPILICFFCSFVIDEFDIQRTVHRDIFL